MFGQRPVGRFAPPVNMFFLLAAASLAVPAWAQAPREIAIDFEDGRLDGWEIKGDVRIERIEAHGGRACLRIGQKGEATLTIAPEDGFGTVEMWVYDSGLAREGDAAKERAYGPLWGLTNSAAERLVFGLLWAPYLSGNGTYGWISTVKNGYASRQYARVKRGEGWHRWEFIVTNETDIVVRMDEKHEATAFDVMTAAYHRGFNGVFFRGGIEIDEPLLVDDIRIAYQPEPLAPRTRPLPGEPWKPPDLEPLHIKPELARKHPRLFFTAEQIPDIRRRCQTTHQSFFETLMSGAASYLKQMPPEKSADCSNDQDMQQWAWWRLGVLSFAYVATGERQYSEKAKEWLFTFCSYPDWGAGGSKNQSMGTANMISGVACAYDWIYDLLTEDERETVRQKLLKQVSELWHLGFADPSTEGFWKQDHQNNHMHHRLSGLLLGSLAIAGEVEGAENYLAAAAEQCRMVHNALPPDGSNHEGPGYMAFGYSYVVRCFDALRHTMGIDLFDSDCLRNAPWFRAHMLTPGFQSVFNFGDGGQGTYYFNHYLLRLAGEYEDGGAQALMDAAYQASPGSFTYAEWPILWYDPSVKPRPLAELPTWRYFSDLEVATYRSSWEDPKALAVFFKCGPYGGHRLNELREAEGRAWVNVAHDHPDANSFMIFANGHFFATDDAYPKKRKLTESHNTILVDGKGQAHRGTGWSQPISRMGEMGRIDAFFGSPGRFAARGDATQYYAGLTEAHRWVVAIDDEYVLVLDSLKSGEPHRYEWLYHCDGDWSEAAPGRFTIQKDDATFGVHLLLPESPDCALEPDVFEEKERGKILKVSPPGEAAEAHYLAILAPRGAPYDASVVEDGDIVELTVTRGELVDCILFNGSGVEVARKGLMTDGLLTIVTSTRAGALQDVTMIGGSRVSTTGVSLTAAVPLNLRWQPSRGGGTLWASAPPSAEPDTVRVTVGGLRPRVTYTLGLTGRKANVAAGADGGLAIDVEVRADTEKLEVLASPRQFKDRPFTD